jgi:lysophospholipase L1-like esterase
MRSAVRALLAALLAGALASCGSSRPAPRANPAASGHPAHGHPAHGYLALGDSLAFGYRPPSVTRTADYLNPANFTGYPEDLARALGLRLANASCPGETAASMINSRAPSSGCETSAGGGLGYRSLAPLHVSYTGSQLSYAVRYLRQHPETRLVTIDIGANDMFLCQESTADHCTGADFGRALATVTRNLDAILYAVREAAGYRYALAVLTYYAMNYADPVTVTRTRELNTALAGPAARYGARLADGFAAFRAASVAAGGYTCAAGLGIRLPDGQCDEHPTARGQQLLATAVERVLREKHT